MLEDWGRGEEDLRMSSSSSFMVNATYRPTLAA